jgi:acetyl esterase/lipase
MAASIVFCIFPTMNAQEYKMPLYNGAIPNSKPSSQTEKVEKSDIKWITSVKVPDIAVYLPVKKFATGQAVVICPGGGYAGLAYDLEGTEVAKYLNSIGVAGVVLKYRLPSAESNIEPYKSPLMDAQRALRLVRYNAKRWNISPDKIGIMGFSAGGHLASTLGTHFDYGDTSSEDSVERMSCRPDFMILMYPVITFTEPCMHRGSRDALLGKNPPDTLVRLFSNELQVKDDSPPAFFVHADNDTAVPVENTLLMYEALRAKKISAELHILTEGEHGFGMGVGNPHLASWTRSLKLWLEWLDHR